MHDLLEVRVKWIEQHLGLNNAPIIDNKPIVRIFNDEESKIMIGSQPSEFEDNMPVSVRRNENEEVKGILRIVKD